MRLSSIGFGNRNQSNSLTNVFGSVVFDCQAYSGTQSRRNFGRLKATLGDLTLFCSTFMAILGDFKLFGATFGDFGRLWAILTDLRRL